MNIRIFLGILIVLITPLITSSQGTVLIKPKQIKGWTGSVRSLDGSYDFLNGEIKTGKGSFYSFFRGYAMFDLADIPDDATIDKIELILVTKPYYQIQYEAVKILELSINPVKSSPKMIFNYLNDAPDVAPEGDYLTREGIHKLELNSSGLRSMQQSLQKDWWAIGFRQTGEGENAARTVGGFMGYDFADSIAPVCKVTYSFEYMRTTFENRKVTYVKKMKFQNTQIIISAWDHLKVDGDIITIYLNGQPVIEDYYLVKEKKIIHATLRTAMPNDLFLYAHNEGQNPPNTVSLEISDGISSESFVLSSDLKSCEAVLITVGK
jgi:hypothetical protein